MGNLQACKSSAPKLAKTKKKVDARVPSKPTAKMVSV